MVGLFVICKQNPAASADQSRSTDAHDSTPSDGAKHVSRYIRRASGSRVLFSYSVRFWATLACGTGCG